MARLSILFSILFVWFLLFGQQTIIQTTGFVLKSSDESINEDSLVSNETVWEIADDDDDDDDDDLIELNVSGQKISTFRSTLTAVPNSKIALMFMKNNSNIRQSRDEHGAVFFDYNPIQFNYLLDQLRMIKRSPEIPVYELDIRAPSGDIRTNFSYMISDLGLNPERFLLPLAGTHLNLNINSLIGWEECYRSTYDIPFNLSALMITCKSRRLLVACHSVANKENLVLAGVGKWENILRECTSIYNCATDLKNNTSFYYVTDQAWGFEGRPQNSISINDVYHYHSTPYSNPCDARDQYSEYRLCWSLRSSFSRGGGDRCGTMKNLHNTADWERVIYKIV